MDVVGVVTLLVHGGAQVVLHGDQVVELSVLLGSQRATHMDDYADGMRLKNTLSHEVHVTQTSRGVTKLRALSACS